MFDGAARRPLRQFLNQLRAQFERGTPRFAGRTLQKHRPPKLFQQCAGWSPAQHQRFRFCAADRTRSGHAKGDGKIADNEK